MNRNLTDIELSIVCEMIDSRMGLNFPIERWDLLNRSLVSAAREFGFQDMSGFIQWLLSINLDKEQMEILAAHLTISETYFWREPQVFTALTDVILPELIRSKKKRERSIRIWSAGCSTGEEPYSIATALHKTIPKIEDWNITILATDINPRALNKASSGIYREWSFRNSPSWLKSRYFHHKEDRQFEIIPEIKKLVTFTCLSLVEMSAISNANTMDIIFCRNVLMYFTNEWAAKVSQNLFHSLSEEGWLVVSSCELSSQLFPQFVPVNFPGAILYQKGNNVSSSTPDDKAEKQIFIETLTQPEVALEEFVEPQPRLKTRDDMFNENKISIRLLADKGHLEEALSICNDAIASDKLAPGLYFLRASILQEQYKSSEAVASLRQAIYIDPDYIMGHFTLGNLFIRQGNSTNAKRYFNNALELLKTISNDVILEESEGLSVKYIREIIFANMQTQKSI
jgi:chemotaxis protein methyltransferase CheR